MTSILSCGGISLVFAENYDSQQTKQHEEMNEEQRQKILKDLPSEYYERDQRAQRRVWRNPNAKLDIEGSFKKALRDAGVN